MIIRTKHIEVKIFQTPTFEHNNVRVWGFPLNEEILLKEEWTEENLNKVNGYFFAIKEYPDHTELANDILGGYRVYYSLVDERLVFSDAYETLKKMLNNNVTVDSLQLKYWRKHRFTLDDGTLFNEIKKIAPATIILCNKDGVYVESYYKDYANKPNYNNYLVKNNIVIEEQLKLAYEKNKKSTFLLFYSGGTDSTYLLCMLKELLIPFKCVVIRYNPRWSIGEKEYAEAVSKLSSFGITDYDTLDVDLNAALDDFIDEAKKEMFFDRHISVHFYETYRRVAERYGTDVVIVNGQSADSIMGFGPTDMTKGFFIQRCVLYSSVLTNLIWTPFVKLYLGVRYCMPWTNYQRLLAMLDEHNYWFVVDTKCEYRKLLTSKLTSVFFTRLKNFASKRMYAKIISFLQGPDNQIVLKAANHFGIRKVIMPFTAPEFIYNVVKYKNDSHEMFVGKYFVRDILKTYLDKYQIYTKKNVEASIPQPDFDMEAFEQNILKTYQQYLNDNIKI